MEHSGTKTNHMDGFLPHGYAENNRKQNLTLVEITPLEGTPFAIVREDKKHFLVIGDHKLSPDFTLVNEVKDYLENNQWLIITNVVLILIKKQQQLEEQIKLGAYETTSL